MRAGSSFKSTDGADRDGGLRFKTVLSLFLPMEYPDA